jgi:group I intron endonuclease
METCKIFYCYKVTNEDNGKCYIGFAGSPKQRWSQHKRDAEKGKGFALAAAIRKYGWDVFTFEVICCGRSKLDMLTHVEPALIEQYQSRISQNGYNVTRGGEQIPVNRKGGSKKGRVISEETRRNMSAAKRGNSNAAGNKGRKHSEATRQKMSNSHKGHSVSKEARRKIGAANSHPLTEEAKKRLRDANIG